MANKEMLILEYLQKELDRNITLNKTLCKCDSNKVFYQNKVNTLKIIIKDIEKIIKE